MTKAYLSLGSNIGEPLKNLSDAIEALRKLPDTSVTAVSPVYITAPVGFTQQSDFHNICAELETKLPASMLLGCCLGVEAAMGRLRPFKNSPRVIDIDLLLYGDTCCETEYLTLPHPRMNERAFVLVPLNDILPNEIKQRIGLDALLNNTASQQVKKLKTL